MKINFTGFITGLVFTVFLVLKLAGIGVVASWSWLWVFSPLWAPLAVGMLILVVVLLAIIIKSVRK